MAESRDGRSEQQEAQESESGNEQRREEDEGQEEQQQRAGAVAWGKADSEQGEGRGDGEPSGRGDQSERQSEEEDEERKSAEEEEKEHDEPEEEVEPRELSQDELIGMEVVDSHGYKVGKIDALFIHQEDERASWARVKTGIGPLGSHSIIPLHDAQDDDGQIRIVYEREHVGEAPEIEPDGNEISDEDADQLHTHYGLEPVTGLVTETKDEDIELSRDARDAEPPTMKERPWAVEKYPLPDMDREPESERDDGEDRGESDDEGDGEEAGPRDEQQTEKGDEPEGRQDDEEQGDREDDEEQGDREDDEERGDREDDEERGDREDDEKRGEASERSS